ncbi:hypothetical protein IC575_011635 [Cucumis melo]
MEKTSGLAPGQGPRNTSFKLGSNVCFCPPTDPNGLFKPKFTCNILALIFFFIFHSNHSQLHYIVIPLYKFNKKSLKFLRRRYSFLFNSVGLH